MSSELFRLYEAADAGPDGYPEEWHRIGDGVGLKHIVRARAGDRCLRCGHPYRPGMGEWSPCDYECHHDGPIRLHVVDGSGFAALDLVRQAQWRILTVHHLNGVKVDCRWWNLVALCQRDHLLIQRKVRLERAWPWEHSEWFKPYAAGWYAWTFLGRDLTREEVAQSMDDLLALGARESAVERMPL